MEKDLSKSTQAMLCSLCLCISVIIVLAIIGAIFKEISVYMERTAIAISAVFCITSLIFKVLELFIQRRDERLERKG